MFIRALEEVKARLQREKKSPLQRETELKRNIEEAKYGKEHFQYQRKQLQELTEVKKQQRLERERVKALQHNLKYEKTIQAQEKVRSGIEKGVNLLRSIGKSAKPKGKKTKLGDFIKSESYEPAEHFTIERTNGSNVFTLERTHEQEHNFKAPSLLGIKTKGKNFYGVK